MALTKAEKLARIPSGGTGQRPIPPWPKLPKCLYDRHPEDKEALDQYQRECDEFFKKTSSRAS